MFEFNVIRTETIATLGALSVFWGAIRAESSPQTGAAATLEVKVPAAQSQAHDEARYRGPIEHEKMVI